MLSAVRFGWNSVFSVDSTNNKQLSDADIERIIDRTRGGAAVAAGTGTDGSASVESDKKEEEGNDVQVVGAGENFVWLFASICLIIKIYGVITHFS